MDNKIEFAKRRRRRPTKASTRKKISRALDKRDGLLGGSRAEKRRNKSTKSRRGMKVAAVGATGAALTGAGYLALKHKGQVSGVKANGVFSGGSKVLTGDPSGNSKLIAAANGTSGASGMLRKNPVGGNTSGSASAIIKSPGGALVKRNPMSSSLAVKSQTSRVTDIGREIFNRGKSQSDSALTVSSGGINSLTTNGIPRSSSFEATFKSGAGKVGAGVGKLADRTMRTGQITGQSFREGYAGAKGDDPSYKIGKNIVKSAARVSGGAVGLGRGMRKRFNKRRKRK